MKYASIYLCLLLMFGCSSNDDSGDSNSDYLPIEPSNLIVLQNDNNDVALSWTDNSETEEGFKIERKVGSGSYSVLVILDSGITGFTDTDVEIGTTYSYRACSYNSYGNSSKYSNEATVAITDPMEPVTIGTQQWMKRNLNTEYYRNGDPIPQVQDPTEWANLTTGAWCYYENTTANGTTYSKLYNGYAVVDPRGLAPLGWHIPTDAEWTVLNEYLGGGNEAGGKMKAQILWNEPNTGATNSSGFNGLPGGVRRDDGSFANLGYTGYWWTSSMLDYEYIWQYSLYNTSQNVFRSYSNQKFGYYVRCLKN